MAENCLPCFQVGNSQEDAHSVLLLTLKVVKLFEEKLRLEISAHQLKFCILINERNKLKRKLEEQIQNERKEIMSHIALQNEEKGNVIKRKEIMSCTDLQNKQEEDIMKNESPFIHLPRPEDQLPQKQQEKKSKNRSFINRICRFLSSYSCFFSCCFKRKHN